MIDVDFYDVISTNIAQIGYQQGCLFVRFLNGKVYRYDDVPFSVFETLLMAPSVGAIFNAKVKKAGFVFRRLS